MEAEYKTCPNCGNPECNSEFDSYCWNCGAFLTNHCPNPDCESQEDNGELSSDMCYCPICGGKSEFYQNGYIQPLKFNRDA